MGLPFPRFVNTDIDCQEVTHLDYKGSAGLRGVACIYIYIYICYIYMLYIYICYIYICYIYMLYIYTINILYVYIYIICICICIHTAVAHTHTHTHTHARAHAHTHTHTFSVFCGSNGYGLGLGFGLRNKALGELKRQTASISPIIGYISSSTMMQSSIGAICNHNIVLPSSRNQ